MEKPAQSDKRGPIKNALVLVGGAFTLAGLVGLMGLINGYLPEPAFALGGESGLRVTGGLAVLGCMIAAVGFIGE